MASARSMPARGSVIRGSWTRRSAPWRGLSGAIASRYGLRAQRTTIRSESLPSTRSPSASGISGPERAPRARTRPGRCAPSGRHLAEVGTLLGSPHCLDAMAPRLDGLKRACTGAVGPACREDHSRRCIAPIHPPPVPRVEVETRRPADYRREPSHIALGKHIRESVQCAPWDAPSKRSDRRDREPSNANSGCEAVSSYSR